jgi:two-component sensor histidine kinase
VETETGNIRLEQADERLLNSIRLALPILSDLSRSDLLLHTRLGSEEAVISDQARPHSIFPVHEQDLVGQRVTAGEAPWVMDALSSTRLSRGAHSGTVRDAPIVRECLPVLGAGGRAIAALSIETNLLAHERHRRRGVAFRHALKQLQEMVLRGELVGAGVLSPFGEHDGILVVDLQRRIQYTSGIAANLYRHIGYLGNLVRWNVYSLETADAQLVDDALTEGTCQERETDEHGRIWIRKALPLYVRKESWQFWLRAVPEIPSPLGSVPMGVMLTVHDATDARDKERELRAKLAMIQEIHHRVKNNLQVIASLLRLQARRIDLPEVQLALSETVNRILSVAVVHEFLSYNSAGVINLREVAQRIVDQMAQSVMDPAKGIRFQLTGPTIYLSSQQATTCSLVINELLLNAVEHGYQQRDVGLVTVDLADDGEWVSLEVGDDGAALPHDFDLDAGGGLGLRIVKTLVQGDLKGTFALENAPAPSGAAAVGVRAIARFPKASLGGTKS